MDTLMFAIITRFTLVNVWESSCDTKAMSSIFLPNLSLFAIDIVTVGA